MGMKLLHMGSRSWFTRLRFPKTTADEAQWLSVNQRPDLDFPGVVLSSKESWSRMRQKLRVA